MTREWMPLMGTGLAVRMNLLNEAQARINHGQSLDRLAERGGLGACEALAIAERRQWEKMGDIDALKALALMGSNVEHNRRQAALSPGVRVDGPVGPLGKE